mgnify:CR=1 FL=1
MKLLARVTLAFQEGASDKVYEIDLCEVGAGQHVVNYRYGRRGSALREGTETETPVSPERARVVFDRLQASNNFKVLADHMIGLTDQLRQQQQQLLARIHREMAALPPPDPARDDGDPQHAEHEERRRQLLRQLAEIEKRINEENARPKKRYISPATREAVYAIYYDGLRRRIEARGTRDFPEYRGRKLYGELTMNVTVDSRGRVVDAEVVVPSGQRVLDQRALAIVRAAAPFGPFNAAMQQQADQIVVTSRFRFTRDEGLETSLSHAP